MQGALDISNKPYQLTYVGPRLRGQATTFTQWQIYPLSSNQFWQTNAIIKIAGNTTNGLVDWYRSHLQFQVQVPVQYVPVGGLQVDTSAYSAIKQIVIFQNAFQLQRIMDADVLSAYLIDVGFSQFVSANKQGMGVPYNNFPQSTNLSTPVINSNAQIVPSLSYNNTNANIYFQYNNTKGYSPTLTPTIGVGAMGPLLSNQGVNLGGTSVNHASTSNTAIFPQNWANVQLKTNYAHRMDNLRAQYKYFIQQNSYPQSASCVPLSSPTITNQAWTYSTMTTTGYNKNYPYGITFNAGTDFYDGNNLTSQTCGIQGYGKPITPDLARGGFQPMLSATIPQCQMSYGQIQNYPTPISIRKFRIPLMSSICGINIPPDQFRLFPIQLYQGLLLQLTMNIHFMFSTGYSDVHQIDTTGMSVQIPRKWRYNQFKWVWHLYNVADVDLAAYLQAVMYKPITFSSKYWQMLIQFQLPNGQYVKQVYQIPVNVQSLTQIVILFLSNQYLSFTGARKQFRLSNNITTMQLRANTIYYPVQPITGNAGNPQTIDQTGDNWNFLQLIYLSNNYLFSTNVPAPRINQKNFAVNSRIYDTTNTKTLYDSTIFNNVALTADLPWSKIQAVTLNHVNTDTAMGQSFFHQNRYIGRAAYTYSFQPYAHSRTYVHGVNTLGWKQFQVSFNCSTTNSYPHDQTQYIFGQCNILVTLQKGKIMRIAGV